MAQHPNGGSDPGGLGATFGNQIYEQTRRRFSNQFAGARRNNASQFARRGAIGSSASAAAEKDLQAAEFRTLQDASLNAQVAGTQLGFQEAGRLEGIRQFDISDLFRNKQLDQQGQLTREGFDLQKFLQGLSHEQQLEILKLQRRYQQDDQGNQLLGSIFGGAATILGGPIGGGLYNKFFGGNSGGSLGGVI